MSDPTKTRQRLTPQETQEYITFVEDRVKDLTQQLAVLGSALALKKLKEVQGSTENFSVHGVVFSCSRGFGFMNHGGGFSWDSLAKENLAALPDSEVTG